MIYSFRGIVLDLLERSNNLETSIIARKGYCGGIDRENDDVGLTQVREEYYKNLFGSDYVVCVRGLGNYSYRFYETLASGRIPIFVNTDSPLPFAEKINWKDYCVWVELEEVTDIAEIVASHYESLTPEAFLCKQKKNRLFWANILTPEKYFAHFFTFLQSEARE